MHKFFTFPLICMLQYMTTKYVEFWHRTERRKRTTKLDRLVSERVKICFPPLTVDAPSPQPCIPMNHDFQASRAPLNYDDAARLRSGDTCMTYILRLQESVQVSCIEPTESINTSG